MGTRMTKRNLRSLPMKTAEDAAALEALPAAERIVSVARELFCRDGIHATGIDRILATAGASKMTLYTRFGSKEALLREVLLREGAEWRAAFFADVAAVPEMPPIDQLRRVVPALVSWFEGGRFYGCAFMNAAAEHAKGEPMLREMAGEHHRHILAFLEGLAADAGLAEPMMLSRQILLCIDGTIAALMVSGDPTVLTVAARSLDAILTQSGMTTLNKK